MRRFLFLVIILGGCQSRPDKGHWQMQLPVHINNRHADEFTRLLPDSVREKSFTKALLYESGGVKTYLTIPMPAFEFSMFLQTVGADGKEIANLLLVNAFADENVSDISILPDRKIVAIDTTYAIVIDSLGNVRDDIREMSVTTRTFRVTEGGAIEEADL